MCQYHLDYHAILTQLSFSANAKYLSIQMKDICHKLKKKSGLCRYL